MKKQPPISVFAGWWGRPSLTGHVLSLGISLGWRLKFFSGIFWASICLCALFFSVLLSIWPTSNFWISKKFHPGILQGFRCYLHYSIWIFSHRHLRVCIPLEDFTNSAHCFMQLFSCFEYELYHISSYELPVQQNRGQYLDSPQTGWSIVNITLSNYLSPGMKSVIELLSSYCAALCHGRGVSRWVKML